MVWLKASANRRVRTITLDQETPPLVPAVTQSTEALKQIRKLIEEGHFPEGAKLPPERALAAQLGLGRPSLREAIKALTVLGLLESRRGSGTYVKSPEPLASEWPGNRESETIEFGVLHLLEFRKILEPRAAWLAATRATERQMLDIEAARRNLEEHDRDWRLVAKLDFELHTAIIQAAQNPVFNVVNQCLKSQVLRSKGLTDRFAPNVERMRTDHRAIVEAILKQQADAAEQAMVNHLHSMGMGFLTEAGR